MPRPSAAASLLALALSSSAHAQGPLADDDPQAGFDVYAVDEAGGGWTVHRLPGRGDTLWGCADVREEPKACVQVFFAAWRTGTQLEVIHVSDTSQAMWLRLHAPGWGDTLLACYDPETRPRCAPIPLELFPRRASLGRVWPPYAGPEEGGHPDGDPRQRVEPVSKGAMWIEAGANVPGPVNLYACVGLDDGEPRCRMGLPNLLRIERQGLGFRRLQDARPDRSSPSEGAVVVKLDEDSAGFAAGLREGDVIVAVGGFTALDARTVQELAKQYPAGTAVPFDLQDGRTIEVVPRPTARVAAVEGP